MDRPDRSAFALFRPADTRWMDNDAYGHLNNVVYYGLFDTSVNAHLIEAGVLDQMGSEVFGVVAETGCRYFGSVGFPDRLEVGLAVERLGRSSATYRLGVFRQGDDLVAAAGRFVHVYVDRQTRRPAEVPAAVRALLEPLVRA
ncbi:thioesterase family protein [Brevundimonas sp. 2R-24]|uniref:Thioesterase family protein n=1 Tax=Peiella sedimenti TaxID=3061083 RepID=A0ABT8SKG9_9CAUL|nr:thioesterase family protein [Caulobacteraceae bacterium XZ-24]